MSSKFRLHPLTTPFALATHAARPPFHLLLAIADSARREGLPLFSPFHAINQLLGSFENANKLLDAKIWAPTLDPKLFARFVGLPYPHKQWPFSDMATESLRAKEFLERAYDFVPPGDTPAPWPIVHFVGRVNDAPNGEPILQSEFFGDLGSYSPGALRDALVACGTRLFILQCLDLDLTRANQLAEWIAGGGGPAVLVAAIDDQNAAQGYFLELLAGLVHNLPLTVAAEIPNQLLGSDMEVDLYFGLEAENSLQLDRWITHLKETIAREHKETLSVVNIMKKWNDRQARYLHPDQIARREKHHNLKVRKYEGALKELSNLQVQLESLPPQPWHREIEGALPVARATNEHDSLNLRFESLRNAWQPAGLYEEDRRETETTNDRLSRGGTGVLLAAPPDVRVPFPHDFREWMLLADEETERAPRVLNAAFRHVKDETLVEPKRAMQPGSEYDLLVDIGPRWNRMKSLVRGQAGFPEYAVDPKSDGNEIDVLFVSEHFTPHTLSARLWLPQGAGRSHPIVNGRRSKRARPLPLRLRTPELAGGKRETFIASGRLCLYYRNNLLQAATVLVTIAAETEELEQERENRIDVDFVLTSTFQQLDTRFAGRALNLLMNDDGRNGHRIVLMGGIDTQGATTSAPPSAGWVPYNPQGTAKLLEEARRQLLNCFRLRDGQGILTNDDALNHDNGKSRDQFQYDLRELSKIGAQLFAKIATSVDVEGDRSSPLVWAKILRKKLEEPSVVQVARSALAEYAFPWALVYDIPMPGPNFKFCPMVEEWNEAGLRAGVGDRSRCPHADEEFHLENVYCPYGLWGLKHIVEQPPSVLRKKGELWTLREAIVEISAKKAISLAVGTTRDPELDQTRIEGHLAALKGISSMEFSAQSPAEDVDTMRLALESPEIAYFLCHGKIDPNNNLGYLGVGDPDDANHQLFPTTVEGWAVSEKPPDLSNWLNVHPLVFINGCHTADLKPEQTLQFVSAFGLLEASGVLGTEISVRLPLAIEVAQQLLTDVAAGRKLGEALRSLRWRLANKGNLLGLAYTLYAMADLHVARATN